MKRGTVWNLATVVLSLTMGCGSSQTPATSAATPVDAGAPAADASPEAAVVVAHPFASTPLEAQSLIQAQVDGQMKVLWKCVADFRTTKKDPHKAVVVDIGIDQEGTLLGVTSPNPKQGELDPTLRECMRTALHGLAYPRSHAGIITVRQTFTDVSVTP
jgi:hypothetical protein